jgi:phytoene dehydrogenase-like protein
MSGKYDYDVIIIGAGIGGLVCGCYLAKAGMKVLIVEQHYKPGGYCTSFNRTGYKFDVGVHYIGGVTRGILSKILDELKLREEIKFNQSDPSDKILMPDSTTYIRSNPYDTIKEFQKTFPDEKENIKKFFQFVMETNILVIYHKVKNLTLEKVLDNFFNDHRLKATIGVLLLGNMGLPHTEVAAFAAIILFREFILDPGYYPIGGMQQFADCLVDKFKKHSGELILSRKVIKIITEDNAAKGVVIAPEEKITSKMVVSNIDTTLTFKELIEVKTKESVIVDSLISSNSIFAVYLGVSDTLKNILNESCNIWFFTTYDIDGCYRFLEENVMRINIPGIMLTFPSLKNPVLKGVNKNTIQIFTIASYENEEFWNKNRQIFSEEMLFLAEKVIPNLKQHVNLTVTATPHTFYKYTMNKRGAAYGWASSISQIDASLLPQKTSIQNLFLVGHWCTMGGGQGGISTVALSGKKAAEIIINKTMQT